MTEPIDIEKLSKIFSRPVDTCAYCKSPCNVSLKELPEQGLYPYSECLKCGWEIYLMHREEE